MIVTMKIIISLLMLVLLFVPVYGEVEGLTTLRNTYSEQLNKISDEEMVAVATLQAQYISSLAGLEKEFQGKGRLDPLLKAKEERERFSADKSLDDSMLNSEIPEIAALQRQYLAGIKSLPLEPAQKKLTLAQFYKRSLKNLEAELTRNNDIAGAIEVKKEREGLESRDEIVKSRAIVEKLSKPADNRVPQPVEVADVPAVVEAKADASVNVDKAKIASQVKIRFAKFIEAVSDQDWDGALKFVDPQYLERNGSNVSTDVLRMKFTIPRHITENPSSKVRCGDIEVEESGDQVRLTIEIWANNRSHTLQRMNWQLNQSDGEWYVKLPSGAPDGNFDRRPRLPQWQR